MELSFQNGKPNNFREKVKQFQTSSGNVRKLITEL